MNNELLGKKLQEVARLAQTMYTLNCVRWESYENYEDTNDVASLTRLKEIEAAVNIIRPQFFAAKQALQEMLPANVIINIGWGDGKLEGE